MSNFDPSVVPLDDQRLGTGPEEATALATPSPLGPGDGTFEPLQGSFWRTIYAARSRFDRVLVAASLLLFGSGIIVTFAGALARLIPRYLPSMVWAEEYTRYSIISAVFLVLPIGIRRGTQLSFEYFLERAPTRVFQSLSMANALIMMGFFAVVAYFGYRVALLNRSQLSPLLHLSLMYPYLVVAFSAFLMFAEAALRLAEAASGVAPRPNASRMTSAE